MSNNPPCSRDIIVNRPLRKQVQECIVCCQLSQVALIRRVLVRAWCKVRKENELTEFFVATRKYQHLGVLYTEIRYGAEMSKG
jgi:hypothetical protein